MTDLVGDREPGLVRDGGLPGQGEVAVRHARDDGLVAERHRHARLLHLVEVRVLLADGLPAAAGL